MADRKLIAVGKRIRRARRSAGLSQEELARKIGCRAQTISRYERGSYPPSFDAIDGIARVCGTTADYIVRGIGVAVAELRTGTEG
jgi:transcriptional regulator with XRE-family HTH domain